MKFVDLFAGLGGFHLALRDLKHRCVFACEIDSKLGDIYELNYGIRPHADIRSISPADVPSHDILCAGFPCQPFSKAGDQRGLKCPKWGDLFEYVRQIISHHKPNFFLLENVPHLVKHDDGKTWVKMKADLEKEGYEVLAKRLSPHRFGIPQIRERIFIVGSRKGLSQFTWPDEDDHPSISLVTALDKNPADARQLSPQLTSCLEVWQEFLNRFPRSAELPYYPIWSMEFGADYPFEETTPHAIGVRKLCQYRGAHGDLLRDVSSGERLSRLPSYARTQEDRFPLWKRNFIRWNREIYQEHRSWIDGWSSQIRQFPSSLQKLEWNCKGGERNIWKYVIQIRASGVRVKRPTTAPSLIAMTTTQVPIIAWEKRYITPRECSRLQSMDRLEHLPSTNEKAFEAFGNAVNVSLVRMVAERLFGREARGRPRKTPSDHPSPPLTTKRGKIYVGS